MTRLKSAKNRDRIFAQAMVDLEDSVADLQMIRDKKMHIGKKPTWDQVDAAVALAYDLADLLAPHRSPPVLETQVYPPDKLDGLDLPF
jgi:hypothetical protein